LAPFEKATFARQIIECPAALHCEGLAQQRLFLKNIVIRNGRAILRWPKFSSNTRKDKAQRKTLLAAIDHLGPLPVRKPLEERRPEGRLVHRH